MTNLRALLAVLVILQFVGAGNAHANPGCLSACSAGAAPTGDAAAACAANCQWRYQNSSENGTQTNDSGTVYGSATAPPPAVNGVCAAWPCSNGIRQDAGVTNIVYNYFYGSTNASTTTSCRFVDNDNPSGNGGDLFVPQATLNEFAHFIANAQNIAVSYCVQAASPTYTATASNGNNFELLANGTATPTYVPGVALPTFQQTFSPPLARETSNGSYVTYSPTLNNSPGCAGTFCYNRMDCVKDAAGNTLCNTFPAVETQTVTYTTTPSTNSNCTAANVRAIGGTNGTTDCDGHWSATVAYSCSVTIFGVVYHGSGLQACQVNFTPPVIQSCSANSTTYADGTTFQTPATGTATNTTTPAAPACGSGYTGMQTCTTNFDYDYTCNDGASVLTSTTTPVIESASCTGCVATALSSCTSTVYGSDCGSATAAVNEAHASVYQVVPKTDSAAYANTVATPGYTDLYMNQHVTADVNFATAGNETSVTNLYVSTIDVPLQNWANGFPSDPRVTEWYVVCYQADWVVPTTASAPAGTSGRYTFVVAVDDSMAMYLNGALVFNDNDGTADINSKGQPQITVNLCCTNTGSAYNPSPLAMATVTETAGATVPVMIEYMNGWPVSTEAQLWVYGPGQALPPTATQTYPGQGTYTGLATPANSYLMQLTAPSANPPVSCP